jgi:FixJ family two-component response regulator
MSAELRVFVVDDDAGVRKAVSRLLGVHGFAVESFASAREFAAHAELPDRPSCLVLDVRMPELDGLDLQDHIRRAGLDVAIVFLTGHGDVPTTVRAMKAGAVDFLESAGRGHVCADSGTDPCRRSRHDRARGSSAPLRYTLAHLGQ